MRQFKITTNHPKNASFYSLLPAGKRSKMDAAEYRSVWKSHCGLAFVGVRFWFAGFQPWGG